MKKDSLIRIMQSRVEGVSKIKIKGKDKFLVRIKNNKGNIITLNSFSKEIDATDYYSSVLSGNVSINHILWGKVNK